MADIRPFKAVRPRKDLADKIAALPYDVYSEEEARELTRNDDLTFLNIDRPETQFPEGTDPYAPEVYAKAREVFDKMIEDGKFIEDGFDGYYIYELTMNGRSQSGIVACASADDYLSNVIKKHETTRFEKEQDRIRHVAAMQAHSGPIFLAYRGADQLNWIIRKKKSEEPEDDFVSSDGIRHRVWVINEPDLVRSVTDAFKLIPELYIADGHHRAASAVHEAQRERELHPDYTGEEEFNYFLAVLFAAEELQIMSYNRVIKDLNGLTDDEFMQAVAERFNVTKAISVPYEPQHKGQFGMYFRDTWYVLDLKPEYISEDPVAGLDVSMLQDNLFSPVLGIEDYSKSMKVGFVGGIRGLKELERRCHKDCAAAISLYPTSMNELFAVADDGKLMPPKSTWFEPKLRSGLFIHRF